MAGGAEIGRARFPGNRGPDELAEIAEELRDDVMQTLIAVRLTLVGSSASGQQAKLVANATMAQDLLADEVRRLRALIDRINSLSGPPTL